MGWVFLCLGVVWCWAVCLLWMSSEQVFLSSCFVVNGAGKYFLTEPTMEMEMERTRALCR